MGVIKMGALHGHQCLVNVGGDAREGGGVRPRGARGGKPVPIHTPVAPRPTPPPGPHPTRCKFRQELFRSCFLRLNRNTVGIRADLTICVRFYQADVGQGFHGSCVSEFAQLLVTISIQELNKR